MVDHILINRLRHSFGIQGVHCLGSSHSSPTERRQSASLPVSNQLHLQHVVYLKGVFLVLCLSCCTRPTYSLLPVVLALAHISTLTTHKYIITLLLTCVRQRLSRGVAHRRVGQMDVHQSAYTEHRQHILDPARDASANQEGKLSLCPTRWHRRSIINYRHMPGSPHRQ